MRVGVRIDAGALIGGGHAMRCLTLAEALAADGASATFVTSSIPREIEESIRACGHEVARIPASSELDREGADWHEPTFGDAAQDGDAKATAEALRSVDLMIVDHYLLDRRWHSAARHFAKRILVIDDLANRRYDCDVLIDQTLGRAASDYRALVPRGTKVLAGTAYALLRPEFARERPAALERRRRASPLRRILVSMGSADLAGSTAAVVEQVLASGAGCELDVVLGASRPSLETVRALARRHSRITLHIDSRDMAKLMREADLAIGAAGTTSLERCCLGLPTIAIVIAENQRESASALGDAGALIALGGIGELGRVFTELADDPARLAHMSAAAFAITDGGGAGRIAACLRGAAQPAGPIELRPATLEDSEHLWLWRNDPVTRAQSRDTGPVSWPSHMCWLSAALGDAARDIMIAMRQGAPVGTVHLHSAHGAHEVSITVTPPERGRGIGRDMLSAACARTPDDLHAAIRFDNAASRRLFESCGFARVESNERGFVQFMRTGESRRRKQA